MSDPIYRHFLGTWVLDTATCDYEQGDAPWADTHHLTDEDGELVFTLEWTDGEGETHHASFRARPDGTKIPFNGGPLADALLLATPSPSELILSAFRDGIELMTAARTLSADRTSLELVQTVHLPDGTRPANRATYHRQH